jgi:hypothetical protein
MKKLLTFITASLFVGSVAAQSLHVGVIGGFKSSWLFNGNVLEDNNEQDLNPGFGKDIGLNLAYFFRDDHFGFEVNVLSSTFTQKYSGTVGQLDYKSQNQLNSIDVPLLLKAMGDTKAYFEIGVMYSAISAATYETTSVLNPNPEAEGNVSNTFKSSNISIVTGFGGDFILKRDQLFLNFGARLGYGITDLGGTDGFGNNLNNNSLYDETTGIYKEYRPTHTLFGGLMIGLKYRIPT